MGNQVHFMPKSHWQFICGFSHEGDPDLSPLSEPTKVTNITTTQEMDSSSPDDTPVVVDFLHQYRTKSGRLSRLTKWLTFKVILEPIEYISTMISSKTNIPYHLKPKVIQSLCIIIKL